MSSDVDLRDSVRPLTHGTTVDRLREAPPASPVLAPFSFESDPLEEYEEREYNRRRLAQFGVGMVLLAATVWIAVERPGPWLVIGVVAFSALILWGTSMTLRQVVISSLSVGSFAASVDYISWRFAVVNWSSWWIAVPLMAAELFGAAHSLGIFYTVWPARKTRFTTTRDATLQKVFIVIPTYDEGAEIVGDTVRAALVARATYLDEYPHGDVDIVVLNDGRAGGVEGWEAVDAMADELGVLHVTRTVKGGAKAGNIENARDALGIHDDTLLVVFDADQIAEPSFLLETVPLLGDESVAWVQTGQFYSNLENPVTKWAEHQQAIFYQVLCPGKSASNSAFICGTNVVIRAKALDEIGGFPQDNVTEDFAASLKLHARWRSVFVPGVLARGLGPLDLPSYFTQQNRWAIGTLGVMKESFWSILSPRRSGLTGPQRLQYLLACTHYLSGLKDFIYLLAPLVFLILGSAAVRGATLHDFLLHFVPFFVVSQTAFWLIAGRHTSIRGLFIAFASFPTLVGSLVTVITGRKVGFSVTSKSRSGRRSIRHLVPFIVAAVAAAVSIALAVWHGMGPARIISVVWVSYTLLCILAVLELGIRDVRGIEHKAKPERATDAASVTRRRRRRTGVVLGSVAAALAIAIVVVSAAVPKPAPVEAKLSLASSSSLTWGMMLAGDQTAAAPTALKSTRLGIVGRTQLIGDSFDAEWAKALQDQGSTPWVTLLFGSTPRSIDGGLLAITNGLFDARITAWADAMKAHGGPVMLTVLPQVDGNWSASSAVAGSGLPKDSSTAWARIHRIFQQEGATNVSFVWAPASPWDDAAYAPPADQVDEVLLSVLHVDGTAWTDPEADLRATAAQHPGKPIVLLVGANGGGSSKAAWLRESLAAAASIPAVGAVVYHQAVPSDGSTAESASGWSLDSDADSLAVSGLVSESSHGSGVVARTELASSLAEASAESTKSK
ncbi:glycosyltransferase family 2 protein [Frondihabitans cladoniiphilus]|uniref:GH26 domain-containing protein n=1 Tax=Frondihabitans cladoniiphilus TaxID=715785 RepID=A0ABP8VPV0_9MICO